MHHEYSSLQYKSIYDVIIKVTDQVILAKVLSYICSFHRNQKFNNSIGILLHMNEPIYVVAIETISLNNTNILLSARGQANMFSYHRNHQI